MAFGYRSDPSPRLSLSSRFSLGRSLVDRTHFWAIVSDQIPSPALLPQIRSISGPSSFDPTDPASLFSSACRSDPAPGIQVSIEFDIGAVVNQIHCWVFFHWCEFASARVIYFSPGLAATLQVRILAQIASAQFVFCASHVPAAHLSVQIGSVLVAFPPGRDSMEIVWFSTILCSTFRAIRLSVQQFACRLTLAGPI